jgi:rod shape-determining protein MreC
MESLFGRHRNLIILVIVLSLQVIGLAVQVKSGANERKDTRLIRIWVVGAVTPFERALVWVQNSTGTVWHNYFYLRGVRAENRQLKDQIEQMRLEQVRLTEDAAQAHRLQNLLAFKEQFISKTVAAQVIATSGTEQSRVVIIDKGSRDGIKPDMAVITPDGIVGKVKDVFPLSSQVLLISDHDSGAGVILERSRLQGIVKGTSLGELQITDIMSDEKVESGEHLITSGGDRIYPKGYSVGTVISAVPDRDNDPFQVIKIKPSADLNRLEEVMVITKMTDDSQATAGGPAPMRAADILSQRLPSVPKQDPNATKTPGGTATHVPLSGPSPTPVKTTNSAGAATGQKPANVTGQPKPPATGSPAANNATAANRKSGAEAKKQPGAGETVGGPATANGPAGAAPPKPKPTPKKPKAPAGADSASPGATEPKASDQPGTAQPAATPTPTAKQEKPPR